MHLEEVVAALCASSVSTDYRPSMRIDLYRQGATHHLISEVIGERRVDSHVALSEAWPAMPSPIEV